MVNRCRSIGSAMHEDVRGLLNPDESGATLASLSQIEDGGFAEAEANIDGDAESLILHRDGDPVRAWLNICPHAGRRLDRSEERRVGKECVRTGRIRGDPAN